MGIGSCLSWAWGSPQSFFSHRGALGPGHLVLLPKAGLGSPCLPSRHRTAGQWCPPVWPLPGALLFSLLGMPCSAILILSSKVPSRAFFFQRSLHWSFWIGWREFLLCSCDTLCISHILLYTFVCWCVPSIQNSTLHVAGAQQITCGTQYGLHFRVLMTHPCVHLPMTESRSSTYSSSRALCLTEVLRGVWVEGKARLACGESIVEARESFPCITVICIKLWVYGQNLIRGFVIRCTGIPGCCGVRKML